MGSGVEEKDEDLALFKDMGKRDKTPGFLYPGGDDHLIDAALCKCKLTLPIPPASNPLLLLAHDIIVSAQWLD
jgi:hypothetical protein